MSTMYHVTPFYNRGTILKQGLRIDSDETGHRAVYLYEKPPSEQTSSYDVWAVDTKGLVLDEDYTSEESGSWMSFDSIGKKRLQLHRGAGNPAMMQSDIVEI